MLVGPLSIAATDCYRRQRGHTPLSTSSSFMASNFTAPLSRNSSSNSNEARPSSKLEVSNEFSATTRAGTISTNQNRQNQVPTGTTSSFLAMTASSQRTCTTTCTQDNSNLPRMAFSDKETATSTMSIDNNIQDTTPAPSSSLPVGWAVSQATPPTDPSAACSSRSAAPSSALGNSSTSSSSNNSSIQHASSSWKKKKLASSGPPSFASVASSGIFRLQPRGRPVKCTPSPAGAASRSSNRKRRADSSPPPLFRVDNDDNNSSEDAAEECSPAARGESLLNGDDSSSAGTPSSPPNESSRSGSSNLPTTSAATSLLEGLTLTTPTNFGLYGAHGQSPSSLILSSQQRTSCFSLYHSKGLSPAAMQQKPVNHNKMEMSSPSDPSSSSCGGTPARLRLAPVTVILQNNNSGSKLPPRRPFDSQSHTNKSQKKAAAVHLKDPPDGGTATSTESSSSSSSSPSTSCTVNTNHYSLPSLPRQPFWQAPSFGKSRAASFDSSSPFVRSSSSSHDAVDRTPLPRLTLTPRGMSSFTSRGGDFPAQQFVRRRGRLDSSSSAGTAALPLLPTEQELDMEADADFAASRMSLDFHRNFDNNEDEAMSNALAFTATSIVQSHARAHGVAALSSSTTTTRPRCDSFIPLPEHEDNQNDDQQKPSPLRHQQKQNGDDKRDQQSMEEEEEESLLKLTAQLSKSFPPANHLAAMSPSSYPTSAPGSVGHTKNGISNDVLLPVLKDEPCTAKVAVFPAATLFLAVEGHEMGVNDDDSLNASDDDDDEDAFFLAAPSVIGEEKKAANNPYNNSAKHRKLCCQSSSSAEELTHATGSTAMMPFGAVEGGASSASLLGMDFVNNNKNFESFSADGTGAAFQKHAEPDASMESESFLCRGLSFEDQDATVTSSSTHRENTARSSTDHQEQKRDDQFLKQQYQPRTPSPTIRDLVTPPIMAPALSPPPMPSPNHEFTYHDTTSFFPFSAPSTATTSSATTEGFAHGTTFRRPLF